MTLVCPSQNGPPIILGPGGDFRREIWPRVTRPWWYRLLRWLERS